MIYYGGNDYRDYLAHHGVLGMHWGIRRYQPYSIGYQRKGGEEGKFLGRKAKEASGSKRGASSNQNRGNGSSNEQVSSSSSKKNYVSGRSKKSWDLNDEQKAKLEKALKVAAVVGASAVTVAAVGYAVHRMKQGDFNTSLLKKGLKDVVKIDEKTGLKLKAVEMTADQDMKAINKLNIFDAGTTHNCMLCTTAYDLRRRGFDVAAGKSANGYPANFVTMWYPKVQMIDHDQLSSRANMFMPGLVNQERQRINKLAAFGKNHALTDKVVKELTAQGDGARGNLMIIWGGLNSGHSMAYEIEQGKLIIRDCQTGKKYTNPYKIISRASSAASARLDNIDFDIEAIKDILDI